MYLNSVKLTFFMFVEIADEVEGFRVKKVC